MSRFWKPGQRVRWLFILTSLFLLTACSPNSPQDDAPFEVVKHRILDQFDGEHLGNVVYRPTSDGGEFIGWGRLPLQKWPYGSSDQTQIVPETEKYPYTDGGTLSNSEYRYTNGGTVLDVDRDGAQEVVVGRGWGEGIAESKLYWFDELSFRSVRWDHGELSTTYCPVSDGRTGCSSRKTRASPLCTIAQHTPSSHEA